LNTAVQHKVRRAASIVVATLLVCAARAEDTLLLDGIVVTAPRVETPLARLPGAVSVVEEDRIQRGRQGLGLDESLVRVPGVFMQNRYNFAQDLRVSIRGFGARAPFGIRGIRIIADGIPATLPDGQASVDAIDLDSVSRVEVLRGAVSSLYGNASGGVIDITTGVPPAEPFAGIESSTGADGFTRNTRRTGGWFGGLGVSATVSDLDYDGFRTHSRTESTLLNTRFQYLFDNDTDITLVVRAVDAPRAQDPGALTAAELASDRRQASPGNLRFDAGEELDEQQLGIVYRKGFGDNHEIRLRSYALGRDFANRLPFEDGGQVAFDRSVEGAGVLYTFDGSVGGLGNRVLAGVDLDRQRDDRQRFDNLSGGIRGDLVLDQLETVSSTGLFVQNELALTERLTLTAGLRHDRVRFEVDDRFMDDGVDDSGTRTLSELSPMLGASYVVSSRFIPYANVSSAFETPTTTEFARCRGSGFVDSLDAQQAINYEAGARGQLISGLRYGMALYRIEGRDEIVSRACPGQPGREFFVNAGRTSRDGIELELEARLGPRWTGALAYSYSSFEFDRFRTDGETFDGNEIPGTPRHLVHGELAYRHESGWFAAVDGLYTGDLFVDNANTVTDDASFVMNARSGFERRFGNWTLEGYVGVNNLLDERYNSNVRINAFGGRFFEPAPGTNAYGGLQIRYRFLRGNEE
jgi:iron complex outermembrane receptor protein